MSSEIERAILRAGAVHPSLHPSAAYRRDAAGNGGSSFGSILAVNHALSSTRDLSAAMRSALEALNRQPGVCGSSVRVAAPGGGELSVEASDGRERRGAVKDHVLRAPVVLDGREIGDVAADLTVDAAATRERVEVLLQVVAELIAQSLTLRGLLAGGDGSVPEDDGSGPDRSGASAEEPSLSARVSDFEQRLIEDALRTTRGNRAKAAKLLRTTERILGYRIQQYGIDWKSFRL